MSNFIHQGVGRTGWHIDGSFQPEPFAYSLYHMVSVPKEGATLFIPLTELIERLSPEKFSRWNRLWMLSDRRSGPIHPLIYAHPITKKPVSMKEYFSDCINFPYIFFRCSKIFSLISFKFLLNFPLISVKLSKFFVITRCDRKVSGLRFEK